MTASLSRISEVFLGDVRHALRGLARAPGFSAAVILTLGLGLGANAAMFGVIDRLMLRPFAGMRDPAQVHRVYLQTTGRGRVVTRSVFPYTAYLDLARWSSAFSDHAAFTERPLAIGSGSDTRERNVAGVSASFFGFFDSRPAAGRFFNAAEDSIPRGADVAVLSYGFWKAEFGGRDVIGAKLAVGPQFVTIVGVAPEGFAGVFEGPPPAMYLPITTIAYDMNQGNAQTFFTRYNWDWMSMIVRSKPGVRDKAATANLTGAYRRSVLALQALNRSVGAKWGMAPLDSMRPHAIAGPIREAAGPGAGLESRTLLWVTGVALIVLLIACANVTNLMLARALRRRREIAVRLALGVSRRRLIAQLLTESLLLALLGCGTGVAIAQWGGAALRLLVLGEDAAAGGVTDPRTLAVAAAFAIGAGVVIAAGPALMAIRGNLSSDLRAGARGATAQRSPLRAGLLILQGTLSVILLVGAGLFVRSLSNVREMHMGWDAEPVLIARPNLRGAILDSGTTIALGQRLLAAARAIPGVTAVARMDADPFGTNTNYLGVAGIDSVAKLGRFNQQWATTEFFKAMDTRIIRGRAFTVDDRVGTPLVAVVSESMALRLWPGRNAIGECMQVGSNEQPCTTIVGIAEDAVQGALSDDQHLLYYLPFDQMAKDGGTGARMLIRVTGRDATRYEEEVRRALQREMPGDSYVTVWPLQDEVDGQRRSWRLGATMFVCFGLLALVVAAVGMYGAIAYDVGQRTQELGVRVALGAQASNIVRIVVGQGVRYALIGIAAGTALALAAAHWFQPLLFHQSARDPMVYALVGITLMVVAVAASAVPARRAAKADPNVALRAD
jgi:predicted permease